ncbi:serine/threonine protein kinase [Bradymonas sediminis]|uniref:Protein kinase domain-containing protein n=2 Tax=Bradymonas sediminis TaxID=1548548 RepID=A0A2Z4FGQ2_9DELT|nr:hypothetical protein DN745_01870 [Bradymonas sediminis]TDP77270.1 serine/threonine protein kinase [Bradymonas sediminis]
MGMRSSAIEELLKPGDMIAGRFRIVEQIGLGGFSVVYRAHQESMQRFVALKVLKSTASDDEKTVERFRREALFASHLSHPNTIRLFDYGHTDDGLCYIAMELLEGEDLADVVRTGKPMDPGRAWRILAQCCRSLSEAHRLGLVHRDLKPENIFLVRQADGSEFVKVLDFGVSKAITNFTNASRAMAPLTQRGTVFGTPLYMAPEQAMAKTITTAVDVYGLGHIAFEMLTGHAAYDETLTPMDVMMRQINDPPLQLPPPLDQTPFSPLIAKCTIKDPEQRIPNAAKLLEHLLHDAFIPYMGEERPGSKKDRKTLKNLGGRAAAQDAPQALETPVEADPRSKPPSVEIFSDLEPVAAAPKKDAGDIAFDTILGFLAQFGDAVPLELWTMARARVLPTQYMGLVDFVIDQAERYGIIKRDTHATRTGATSGDSLSFCNPGFARQLRDGFDTLVEPVQTHRDIAALLLEYDPAPRGENLTRVVDHLVRAEQHRQAMGLLWAAAEDAAAKADGREALQYYLKLASLKEDFSPWPDQAEEEALGFEPGEIWIRLGETHAKLGEQGAAQDALARAVAPNGPSPASVRGRAFKILGDLAVSQKRYVAARTHYRHARDSFRESKNPAAFVAAIGAMGHCALMSGKFSEAKELLGLALNRSQRLQNAVLHARLGRFMARVHMQAGSFEAARAQLQSALKVFEKINSADEIEEVLVELGEANYAEGDFKASRDNYHRALRLRQAQREFSRETLPMEAERAGHIDFAEFADPDPAQIGLARAFAALGELDAATEFYEQALARSLASGERLQQARIRFYLGDLSLARLQFRAAARHFEAAEAMAQLIGHTELWIDATIRLAYVAFDAGDSNQAYKQLSEAMEMAASRNSPGAELAVRAHVIYLQLLEHEFRARGEAFAPLLAAAKAKGLRRAEVLCQIFNADVHTARGAIGQAQALLAEARIGAAELHDYALLVPIARRERDLERQIWRADSPHDAAPTESMQATITEIGIGSLVPPITNARRFFD